MCCVFMVVVLDFCSLTNLKISKHVLFLLTKNKDSHINWIFVFFAVLHL